MRNLLITLGALVLPLSGIAETDDATQLAADLELGFVQTSGNTRNSSFRSAATFSFERDRWSYDAEAEALNIESEGTRTSEKYYFSNRLGYEFTQYNYFFAYASYEKDRFTGFDHKASFVLGYGRRLIDRENMRWDAEVGPGFRRTRVRDDALSDEDADEAIARVSSRYKWEFAEGAAFEQRVSVETGSDNTVVRSITSLTSSLIGGLSMRLSYIVDYTRHVPVNRERTDTQTSVTLVYKFF